MKINSNQKQRLEKILHQYRLKKDIDSLTSLEASILIEGIYNKGKVKETFKDKKLSDESFRRKQELFDSLIEKIFIPATEGQLKYLNNLLSKTNYTLTTDKIAKEQVTPLINFLTKGIRNEVSVKLLKEKEIVRKIKIKKEKALILDNNFPSNWFFKNIDINGIVDFANIEDK